MTGAVYGLASTEQPRSCDEMKKKKKKKKRDDGTKNNVSNDAEEEKKMPNNGTKKNRKAESDAEQRVRKMSNDVSKAKNRNVSSAFFEKEKKKKMLSGQNGEKKMKSDDDRGKKRITSRSVNKNKMEKNETSKKSLPNTFGLEERKTQLGYIMEMKSKKKKLDASSVHSKEGSGQRFITDNKEKKRKAPPTPFKREQKMRVDEKGKKDHIDKKKEKTKKAHSDAKGNEKNISSHGKKKKREAPPAFFKFVCNKFKDFLSIPPTVAPSLEDLTNRYVHLRDSLGKLSKVRLSMMNGSLAFYQGWNNFVSEHFIKWGDFLLFEYSKESTFSVRIFGTDSCERLHFNYENIRKGTGKKQIESNTPSNDVVSHYKDQDCEDIIDGPHVSGEYPRSKELKITVDAEIIPTNLVAKSTDAASETHDPERVESGVGHGSLGALDNKDRNSSNGECETRSVSLLCIQEKTIRSKVIIITESTSSTQENEDTLKETASSAASETHQVTISTQKDPERVADNVWCKSSVAQNNKMGNLVIGAGGDKNVSPTCSKGETEGSKIIVITDATPLTQDNNDTVKLTTFSCLKEDGSAMRESEHSMTTIKCTETHDSDEDLRRKHERVSIQEIFAITMDKSPNNSEMNISGNVSRIYEAPGGNRCLEKWKKGTVSSQAAFLHGIEQNRPETIQKVVEKLVGNCGAMGLDPVDQQLGTDGTNTCLQPVLTMPIEKHSTLDLMLVSECGHSRTEISHLDNKKGVTVPLQTNMEQLNPGSSGSRQGDKIPGHASCVPAHQSEHQISQQENEKSTSCVTPVVPLSAKGEILESDNHSLQFCIPPTNQTWLNLPKPLHAVRPRGRHSRHDRSVIILKDPMKRSWPVFYHDNPIFVGFTAGWMPFATANDLQAGDVCELLKELDEDEPAFRVQITRE